VIKITIALGEREIPFAVHREGEYRFVLSKCVRSAVTLVYITIDHNGPLDDALLLKDADCHSDVVEDTESLAVIGKRMVRASGKMDACSIIHCRASCCNRGTCRAARSLDELGRPGQADPPLLQVAKLPSLEPVDIRWFMDQLQLLVGCGFRLGNPHQVDQCRCF
jgi:hypothetical protein